MMTNNRLKISRTVASCAIAQVAFIILATPPTLAQWWDWRPGSRQQIDIRSTAANSNPIDRATFQQLLSLAQRINDDGTLQQPVALQDMGWRTDLPDQWLRMPMSWQPENAILIRIQSGSITQIDYDLNY